MEARCPRFAKNITEFEDKHVKGSAMEGIGEDSDDDGDVALRDDGDGKAERKSMPLKRWIIAVLMPVFARAHRSFGPMSESPLESFHALVNRVLRNYGKMRGQALAKALRMGVAAVCHQGMRARAAEQKAKLARGERKRKVSA